MDFTGSSVSEVFSLALSSSDLSESLLLLVVLMLPREVFLTGAAEVRCRPSRPSLPLTEGVGEELAEVEAESWPADCLPPAPLSLVPPAVVGRFFSMPGR